MPPIDWSLVVSITIPLAGAVFFIAKYFWNKAKCFTVLKNKVESFDEMAKGSDKTHDDIWNKIGNLDVNIANINGKLDIILSKNGWKQ